MLLLLAASLATTLATCLAGFATALTATFLCHSPTSIFNKRATLILINIPFRLAMFKQFAGSTSEHSFIVLNVSHIHLSLRTPL